MKKESKEKVNEKERYKKQEKRTIPKKKQKK